MRREFKDQADLDVSKLMIGEIEELILIVGFPKRKVYLSLGLKSKLIEFVKTNTDWFA